MKSIITLFIFLFIGSLAFAQKITPKDTIQKKTQDTRYTPGASGVKRSIGYKFSTLVTDADPGVGIFRYNNMTLPEVNFIFVDNNDIKGEDQTNW